VVHDPFAATEPGVASVVLPDGVSGSSKTGRPGGAMLATHPPTKGATMAIAALKMLTLDSSDARRDATFWSTVLGWEVAHAQDEYAMLTGPGGVALGVGFVDDHEPPAWPNEHGTKQFHLDLAVDDLDVAAADCVAAGATLPEEQPGETWRVLLDPSGHPFCLTQAANWG